MVDVNEKELPIEPLHYPAVAIGTAELPPMATASADRQMCVADGDAEPQASEQAGLAGLGLELLLQEGHLALGDPTLLRRQYGGSLTNRVTL